MIVAHILKKSLIQSQDCSGRQNITDSMFPFFLPNPGQGRLPLDSGRGEVEFAGVCSVLGGQLRFRMHILNACRNKGF